MKKFILKILVFSALASLIVLAVLRFYGGAVDYFYVKFTSPKQHSLIIGDSRCFQGIQPQIINKHLSGFEGPIYNYGFTIAQASYGDAYLKSTLAKLDKNTRDGLFILSVHPFLLAQRQSDNFAEGIFFETDVPPNNMKFVDMDPNPEYFFKNFSYFHFRGLFRKVSEVHSDGWLELHDIPKDSVSIASQTAESLKTYTDFSAKFKPAAYRLQKLDETVRELKKYGKVFLVRMPTGTQIRDIENNFWQHFDADMQAIATKNTVAYVNYAKSNPAFVTFDGLHMDNETGAEFTKSLCDSINRYNRVKAK